jgi:serine/threonine protein kinase
MTHLGNPANRERIAELLLQWEELFERGQDTPANELAKDHPELIPELARRISALKTVSWITRLAEPSSHDVAPGRIGAAGRTLGGRYRLDELVAEGGFAEVYKAHDTELQRTVAVKIPKPTRLQSTDSFLAEARRVARLKHDGIVPVHDVGVEDGICFIVSEFLEGGSLADCLVRGKPNTADATRWIGEVADALQYAHSQGIVHLDVKPANILIDHHRRAKLADFGIAKSAMKTGEFAPSLGTLRYMSPEQLRCQTTDHRSDIYSLAVVLYELLTGTIPYSSSEPNVVRREIIGGRQVSWPKDVPSVVRKACEKALTRNPHQRHASAAEFAAEIRSAHAPYGRRATVLPLMMGVVLAGVIASIFLLQSSRPTNPPTESSRSRSYDEIMAMATTNLFHDQFADAEKELTQALLINAKSADALTKRGFCRLKLGALQDAITDLQEALALNPDDPNTLRYRAQAYASLRDFPKAIADLTAVMGLTPDAPAAAEELATVFAIRSHEHFQEGRFREAMEDMNETIRLSPQSPVNYHRRASCFFHMGEYQKAIDDLNIAIAKEPIKADHYENRGLSFQRLGRDEDAEKDFTKAKEMRNQ